MHGTNIPGQWNLDIGDKLQKFLVTKRILENSPLLIQLIENTKQLLVCCFKHFTYFVFYININLQKRIIPFKIIKTIKTNGSTIMDLLWYNIICDSLRQFMLQIIISVS